jgi:hypothetical protein
VPARPGGACDFGETCITDLCRRELAAAAAECGETGEDGDADLDQTLDAASILGATAEEAAGISTPRRPGLAGLMELERGECF